ncbi:MAG: radical SAM protein [Promethearchaeota archaeon]
MVYKKNKILRNLGGSYLKKILNVINGPVYVSIFFTRDCNYNCNYCATSKCQKKSDISLKQWKDIINQLYNQGCRFITIYGGEPTLRADLDKLLKHCIDLNIFTLVITNGSLLNEDLLKKFVSYGYFLLGIGIDSLSETSFSPKHYRPELIKLLQGIKERYPNNIDYSIHITLTKKSINELIPLVKAIHKKLECRFSIDPVHSSMSPDEQFQYRSFCPDLLLKKESMKLLKKIIQNLKRFGIQIWSPNIYYHYMNKWYQKKYSWECNAGDLYYAIDNDGTVMLCEDVNTNIQFNDFIKISYKKRVKFIKKFKFDYCTCFKPCYWNPTNAIKYPIRHFIYRYRFK